MSNAERVVALRAFRRHNEEQARNKTVDFSHGPPDLSGLEGAQRLHLLRQYRLWLDERSKYVAPLTNAGPPAAGTVVPRSPRMPGRPPPTPPCWLPQEPPRLYEGAGGGADVLVVESAPSSPVASRRAEPPLSPYAQYAVPHADAGFSPTAVSAAGGAKKLGHFDYFERPRTARSRPSTAPWLDDARLPKPTGKAKPAGGTNAQVRLYWKSLEFS